MAYLKHMTLQHQHDPLCFTCGPALWQLNGALLARCTTAERSACMQQCSTCHEVGAVQDNFLLSASLPPYSLGLLTKVMLHATARPTSLESDTAMLRPRKCCT